MNDFIPAQVFHPGSYVREEIRARGWTIRQLAEKSGVEFDRIKRVIREAEPVTIVIAVGLARAFAGATFWVNLQAAYTRGELNQIKRDCMYWAELNGETDAVWVNTMIFDLEEDLRKVEPTLQRTIEAAKRYDAANEY